MGTRAGHGVACVVGSDAHQRTRKSKKIARRRFAMPYDSSKRLRLYGLVESLDNAVRTNNLRAAQHYRGRLIRAIEFAADDDPAKPLHDDLKELFKISGVWVRNVGVQRAESKPQILQLIRRIVPLLYHW
jgi:hypothetical protein